MCKKGRKREREGGTRIEAGVWRAEEPKKTVRIRNMRRINEDVVSFLERDGYDGNKHVTTSTAHGFHSIDAFSIEIWFLRFFLWNWSIDS